MSSTSTPRASKIGKTSISNTTAREGTQKRDKYGNTKANKKFRMHVFTIIRVSRGLDGGPAVDAAVLAYLIPPT